jgi:transcriptional regulator with XRE-family HTH domain
MSETARKRFGSKVRNLRLSRGWTQEVLGFNADLHATYIGGIERGERNVSLDNIIRLAVALKVRPADLFSGL